MAENDPDIVYLCRPGENIELRYSLRSLKNVPHGRVWIFGDAPDWINPKTVTLIRTPNQGTKFAITQRSLATACRDTRVSDPFVMFYDDCYVTAPTKHIPLLNRGTVLEVVTQYRKRGINSAYVDSMIAADTQLRTLGYDNPLSFELHTPFPVRKELMLKVLKMKNRDRYQWRTIYGNLLGEPSEQRTDVKVYHYGQLLPAGPFLSTSDTSVHFYTAYLNRKFPTPSPYELGSHDVPQ